MEISDTDLTAHIENYFKSQQAFVDQVIADVTLGHDQRLKLVQTLVHNAYREGMTFAMGSALVTRGITEGGSDD